MSFNNFNFNEELLEGLSSMGFNKATPIQELAIPIILQGKDLIACAQTGTGKTGAYLLPVLQKILQAKTRHLNTLILAPTRELAMQIDQQVEGIGYFLSVSSISIYGGGSGEAWDQQKRALKEGADIIIATPGRLIALLAAGTINLEHLEHLILDEADRMLDMGFFDDIIKIISYLPKKRQTILFSATMPPKIRKLAEKILINPETVNIALSTPAEGILQKAFNVPDDLKIKLLKQIMKGNDFPSIIVFASKKESVKRIYADLKNSGMTVKAFHSDLEQAEREVIMRAFRNKQIQILVGTDIISRGIDVEGISLVVNYDVPPDAEDYIHRIGRTARASTKGTAVTFINEKDKRKFQKIEKLIGKPIQKLNIISSEKAAPKPAKVVEKEKRQETKSE